MIVTNPFGHYGKLVTGANFCGRKDEIDRITERLLGSFAPGNVAVVGIPRIGKSCLTAHVLNLLQPEFHKRRMASLSLWTGSFQTPRDFFYNLALQSRDEIKRLGWLENLIEDTWAKFCSAEELEFNSKLWNFFKAVRQSGIQLVCLLEEFDSVANIFPDVPPFQLLRSLSDSEATRVTLITASRRPIVILEKKGHSTLVNIMGEEISLKPFRLDELGTFYDRCMQAGLSLSEANRERIEAITGRHPYLLDLLGFNLVRDARKSGKADIDAVCQQTTPTFVVTHHDEVFRVLRDSNLLDKLAQILFGPQYDVRPQDIEALQRYGLLRTQGEYYQAFSENFQDALRVETHDLDYWPLWRDTEQGLRRLIGDYLRKRYGDDWVPGLLKKKPSLRNKVDEWETNKLKDERLFGSRASPELLDYTYPMDLYDIIKTDWSVFGRILKDTQANWDARWTERFTLLARFRGPMAHNRADWVTDSMRNEATGLCQRILALLKAAGL